MPLYIIGIELIVFAWTLYVLALTIRSLFMEDCECDEASFWHKHWWHADSSNSFLFGYHIK